MHCSGRSGRFVLFALASALPLVITPPALPQTTWFKYDGNPVLDVGPPDSWDCNLAVPDRVLRVDSTYVMWYTGWGPVYHRIGLATSRDGVRWTKSTSNPIFDVRPGSWDSLQVALGRVVPAAGRYHLWYTGSDGLTFASIGYASSGDGRRWRRNTNPVMLAGPSPWDAGSVAAASVLGDPVSGYSMWYTGFDAKFLMTRIGLAFGSTETTWTKHSSPVLNPGRPGAWDDARVQTPRVLRDHEGFHMWYVGGRTDHRRSQTGYATSSDGMRWTKSPKNPVLSPGPHGSWDDEAAFVGDILLSGDTYLMWYAGHDGSQFRTGLAASPGPVAVSLIPSNAFVEPRIGVVRFSVDLHAPSGLSFFARIQSPLREEFKANIDGPGALRTEEVVELMDDGRHGDGRVSDGLFAGSWSSSEERLFLVDLLMTVRMPTPITFVKEGIGAFTTVGPVTLDSVIFFDDDSPVPGDTVRLSLVLRNSGRTTSANAVTTSLEGNGMHITDVPGSTPYFASLPPKDPVSAVGYHQIYIPPGYPPGTDLKISVAIASSGIPLWTDSFTIHVYPPWWRTDWAYALYGLFCVLALYAARRVERKRMEQKHRVQLALYQGEKLRELDRLKSRFFANISHEFRTPLTLIQGPAEQLARGAAIDAKSAGEFIRSNSKRLLTLVNQLLDLSRAEAGHLKLHPQTLDLLPRIRGVAAAFESLALRRTITYEIRCPDEPVIGRCDPDALEKILSNLLSNAFKFTPDGGNVTLEVQQVKDPVDRWVVVCVQDSGVGISPEHLDRVFERFYQVDGPYPCNSEGTGIGLSLAKELTELHRGTLAATSHVGKGSVFTLRLPLGNVELAQVDSGEAGDSRLGAAASPALADTAREEYGDSHSPADGSPGSMPPLLLVIEDNAELRRYMRLHLDARFRILEAEDGETGLRIAIETLPELILSDVMMPGLDGIEACRRLRTDYRTSHIPIILLTARGTTEDRIMALTAGADDYLTKPFDAQELLVRIQNLIDQRRKLRERLNRELKLQGGAVVATSADDAFLSRAVDIVESRLADPMFDSTLFAEGMGMSRMQLHRKLKALADLGPGEFIRSFRMRRAASLLEQRAGNVSEIAYEVGYSNPSHFAQAFREQFSVTPSEYSTRHRSMQK